MEFDILLITTTDRVKQDLAFNTIKSIEVQDFKFKNKVISIDDFGFEINVEFENYLLKNNWIIDLHPRVGMCENILIGLNYCNSEWLLYCEDDVVVNGLPKPYDFQNIESKLDRNLGILGLLSNRGTGFLKGRYDQFKGSILNKNNYIFDDNYVGFIREEETYDDFFIEFPITFIKRKLFCDLFDYSFSNTIGYQIEMGLTKSFFDGKFSEKYKKVNYWKPLDFEVLKELNYWDIMEHITKHNIFIYNKDNHSGLSHSVNGGKNFKKVDW